jgi:hypothetical protein
MSFKTSPLRGIRFYSPFNSWSRARAELVNHQAPGGINPVFCLPFAVIKWCYFLRFSPICVAADSARCQLEAHHQAENIKKKK